MEFEEERFSQGELEYSSTTFLGCSMEMLRSSLAKWAERNNGGNEGSWRPSLFLTADVHERENTKLVCQLSASADFNSCLQSLRSFSDLSERFFKMRVVWELQNHLQTHLRRRGCAEPRRSHSSMYTVVPSIICRCSANGERRRLRGGLRR